MATVGRPGFELRLQDMVNTRKQQAQLLQAETEVHVTKTQVLHKRNFIVREAQRASLSLKAKVDEITCKIKAVEDQKVAADLAMKDLELKRRVLRVELFELQNEKDEKCKFYETNGAELRQHTVQIQERASTIRKETAEVRTQADELKCELHKVRQLSTTRYEVDTATNVQENERIRVTLVRQAISHNISSNLRTVSSLEQRLNQVSEKSGKRNRELAPAVKALKAEIMALQATNRTIEDQVLQAINRRDKTKRDLYNVERALAQKKLYFHSCQKSGQKVEELRHEC